MRIRFTIFAWLCFSLFISLDGHAQQTVGLFTKNVGEQDGYVLFTAPGNKTYLIDKCGKLIKSWDTRYQPGLDAYLLPNGNLLAASSIANPYFTGGGSAGGLLQIFDWNGVLLWKYTVSDSLAMQDHDICPMPNGNILVLEWDRHTSAQSIAKGRDSIKLKGHELWGVKVQEIKPIGKDSAQVVWEWTLWDHLIQDIDSTKPGFGTVSDHPELLNINYADTLESQFGDDDWIHANAISYNATLDQVMVNSRNLSELYIIDHATSTKEASSHTGGRYNKGGDFLYRWGNPAAYNRETSTNRTLYVQHNPSWIPDGYPGAGNITVFNDGTNRPGGNFSTAEIFAPPVDSKGNYFLDTGKAYGPASSYWSYSAPTPANFYSPIEGGVQKLVNGNVLICESTKGNFFEVDSNKNIVWRYVNPDGGNGLVVQGTNPGYIICFRANLYTEDYPAFKQMTLAPGNPIEVRPYFYNCYMPYNLYINPLYKISQITGYNALSGTADSFGKGKGYIKGVVESQNLGFYSSQFSLIDNTGAITISTNEYSYKPRIGDSLLVSGYVSQYYGLTEYIADTMVVKPRGTWQKQPDVITKMGEKYESSLITLKKVWLVNASEWKAKGIGYVVHVTNGPDTFQMYVNYKTNLYFAKPALGIFDITGVETQSQSKYPFFGGYQIEPRGFFDFKRIVQLYTIRQVRVQDSVSGIADSAGSPNSFLLKGIVQSPDFNNPGLNFSLEDSTGSIIIISPNDLDGYTPSIGDSIQLRGLVIQVNGLTKVRIDSIGVLKYTPHVFNPVIIDSLTETTEAQLVKLRGMHLVDTSQWTSAGSPGNGFDVDITDGHDTFLMQIEPTTDLYKMNVLKGSFNVTGIEWQNQPDSPFLGKYLIVPRGLFDIERYTQIYKIRQVRVQDSITGTADSVGSKYPFFLKGIVQSPNFAANGYEFSIKDSTGAIFITAPVTIDNYAPVMGDSIEVRGLLKQQNGLTEVWIDSISKLGNFSPPMSPVTILKLDENTEARLIKYNSARLIDTSQWKPAGLGFTADITNGTDTIKLYVSSTTNVFHLPAPTSKFNVTGIVSQDKSGLPYLGGYMLMPIRIEDIQILPGIPTYKIREIKGYNPVSGIADSINTYCYLKGVVQSGNLSGKSSALYAIQDSTGSISVSNNEAVNGYIPQVGDSVLLRGRVLQSLGLTILKSDSVSRLTKGILISPLTVTRLNENTESELVKLKGYILVDSTKWDTSGANGRFDVLAINDTEIITLAIVKGTDLYLNTAKPSGYFDVTGIASQADSTIPYFSGYCLMPRSINDFTGISGIAHTRLTYFDFKLFPVPARENIYLKSSENISKIEITDIPGKIQLTKTPTNAKFEQLNISGLNKGIYFIKVYNGAAFKVEKFIKE